MVVDMDKEAVFAIIKRIVDKYNPETVLTFGAPADSYDRDSKEIRDAIDREGPIDRDGLACIIRLVMVYSHHSWQESVLPHISSYAKITEEMWEALPPDCRR